MSVLNDLDKLRAIFLADELDDETRRENETQIAEWEAAMLENEGLHSWQEHDVTKELIAQAKRSYVQMAATLANDRNLDDTRRKSLWAKQDACMYFVALGSRDAKGELQRIRQEVRTALKAG